MNRISVIIFHTGIFLLCSCANKVAPTGGEKDIDPPVLTDAQPENFSVNFSSRKIVLSFNEYVQLVDQQKQILVSPPTGTPPEMDIHKKSIIISLPDSLHPNTTYNINFGNAISDFTENNVLTGFQYVFSTGPEIDSLAISGHALDALTLKPVKNALILLYPLNTPDSAMGIDPPAYYSRAGENGVFTVKSVHEGSYRIAGIDDQNNNFTADFTDETTGILKELAIAGDSISVTLLMTRQPPSRQFIKTAFREPPGKLITVFARPTENVTWNFLTNEPGTIITNWNESRDSLIFYGFPLISDSTIILWKENNQVIDTTVYNSQKTRLTSKQDSVIKLTAVTNPAAGTSLMAETMPSLTWNVPLKSFDFSMVKAFRDSIEIPVSGSFSDSLHLQTSVEGSWKEGNYLLLIPANAAVDMYGNSNDTIRHSFIVTAENTAGSIAFNFTGLENSAYLLQLVNDKDELKRQRIINSNMSGIFLKIEPGIYRLRVVEDENRNNRWDGGSWQKRVWPELVYYYPDMITVRANWEVEINWKLNVK